MVIGLVVANTMGFNPGADLFSLDCSRDYNKSHKTCLEAQSALEDQAAAQGGEGGSTNTGGGTGAPGGGNSTRGVYKETDSPFHVEDLYFPRDAKMPDGMSQPVAESVWRVLRGGGGDGRDSSALIDAGSVSGEQHGTETGKSVQICRMSDLAFCREEMRCLYVSVCARACVRALFLHPSPAGRACLRALTKDVVRRQRQQHEHQCFGGHGGGCCGGRLVGPSGRCRCEKGRGTAVGLATSGTRQTPRGWRIG